MRCSHLDHYLETAMMKAFSLLLLFLFILQGNAENGQMTICKEETQLVFNDAKLFNLSGFSSTALQNENMINDISISARPGKKNTIYEFQLPPSSILSKTITENAGTLRFETSTKWPGFIAKRTVEFYENTKFFRIRYDIEFTQDMGWDGIWFKISTKASASFMLSGRSDGFSLIKANESDKDIWLGFECSPDKRCFAYYYEKLNGGFAVMCPDEKSWREIGKSFLCNRAKNGFSLELTKYPNREVKTGENLSFDFFLMPLEGTIPDCEKAVQDAYQSFFPGIRN